MEKVDPMTPVHTARLCSGIIVARIVKAPAKSPEAPRPATARPAMRACDDGARAHTRLPASNTRRYRRYDAFFGNKEYILPARGWLAAIAIMNAALYQPMSRVESNSDVMTGIAVAIRL
jgi:hypothetical protein